MEWHLLVDKMIKLGFKQSPEYDELCGSPSYNSETSGPDPVDETPTEDTVEYLEVPSEVKNPRFDARKFRTYEKETIVIIDACGPIGSSDIEIDDDETSCDLYVWWCSIKRNIHIRVY